MKKILYLASLALALGLSACQEHATDTGNVLDYVNVFVGTDYTGHTTPAAAYPFGMVQPGPQSGNFEWEYCSGYRYDDNKVMGFTQDKLNGTGVPDNGDLLMMPYSGNNFKPGISSGIDKASEKGSPGYYAVNLTDYEVNAEMTCTQRVALYRYKFNGEKPGVYVDYRSGQVSFQSDIEGRVLACELQRPDEYTVTGHESLHGWVDRQLYFAIRFDKPIASTDVVEQEAVFKAPQHVYHFDLKPGDTLMVKVALSTVSEEGALANMDTELPNWDFEATLAQNEMAWQTLLNQIEVKGTEDQKKNVYTSLYHLYFQPNNICDVDGQFRGADDQVNTSASSEYYSTLSLWDTFRSAQPLLTILQPDYATEIVNSMLTHSEAQGFLPIWQLWGKENYCMIGNHAVPVVVEACLKDLPGIDQERAFNEVKKSLTTNHLNSYWDIYDKYGYYPFDLITVESVSRTLETSFDDYCAAMLAQKLGKKEDAEYFMKRSRYYKNLFDPSNGLMRAKDSKGNWREPFDKFILSHASTSGGDYTEGNAWQYTWHVLHDVDGLVDLIGGRDQFITKLDSLFAIQFDIHGEGFTGDVTGLIGQYAHGNEPSHHVLYLYSLIGEPWRTAELVREVFDQFYLPKPDGLCGNDDCGQMSAWYIFSAMGFYPVNMVSGEYVLGAPQIPEMTINLPNGKRFTVIAEDLSADNKYVASITLNGESVDSFISYSDIMEGGTLKFKMTNTH